ncbi:hypothetical protein [Haladaptatus sp. NG-SE-30]
MDGHETVALAFDEVGFDVSPSFADRSRRVVPLEASSHGDISAVLDSVFLTIDPVYTVGGNR